MTHIFHIDVGAENLPKLQQMYKRVKTFLSWADLLWGENIDHAEKKAQSSDVERGLLHGENDVIKFQILFCKYLCTTFFASNICIIQKCSTRPFFLSELIEKCTFCLLQI